MKKFTIILFIILGSFNLGAQSYYPFPNDTAKWNCLTVAQWSPQDIHYINSNYKIEGDTIIYGVFYNKVYFQETDLPNAYSNYIGGLREDSNRNIYFFPSMTHLPNYCSTEFPSDTTEYLLYTFDSLEPGMILPINTDFTEIQVMEIDSVLLNGNYRRRYKIDQSGLLFEHYWIEGIGSSKDLFASYSHEFEWSLFTLCYTDTTTYYINSPNGQDSCHYWLPTGIIDNDAIGLKIYPNPSTSDIIISLTQESMFTEVHIYNINRYLVKSARLNGGQTVINISSMEKGIYIMEFMGENRTIRKFIKY